MNDLKETTDKLIKDYRNGFDYLHKKLTRIDGEQKKQIIEKHLQKYVTACDAIEMFPEPQICLDIVAELNEKPLDYHK